MSNKKIIVTGANGFVGTSVCDLLQNNFQVIKFVRKSSSSKSSGDEYQVDITDYKQLDKLKNIDDVYGIVHCAGLAHAFDLTDPEEFFKVNTLGTENVAKLAIELNIQKFVLISTVSVYGSNNYTKQGTSIDETFQCKPDTPYAKSKLKAEQLLRNLIGESTIETTIIRLATVIGEGDSGNVSRLISSIDQGKFLWVGNGTNQKSLIYKDDVALGIKKVLESSGLEIETYNLSGESIAMKDIVKTISMKLDVRILPIRLPANLLIQSLHILIKLTKRNKLKKIHNTLRKWISEDDYSSKKFNEQFNFSPQTSIKNALTKEVVWYQSNK